MQEGGLAEVEFLSDSLLLLFCEDIAERRGHAHNGEWVAQVACCREDIYGGEG